MPALNKYGAEREADSDHGVGPGAHRSAPSSHSAPGHRQPSRRPGLPAASEDADVAEAERQQRVRDEPTIMTVAAGAVHDDRLVRRGLQ